MASIDDTLTETETAPLAHRRAPWRQRLVDAESGFRVGLRADSTLLGFLFCAVTVLITALVVGLGRLDWAVLILTLGMALAAELVHQVLKQLQEYFQELRPELGSLLQLGSTGVMCVHLTAITVSLLIFWQRFARVM